MSLKVLVTLIMGVFLIGCSSLRVDDRRAEALKIANNGNLTPFVANTGYFRLQGFERLQEKPEYPTVYIEGDGYAFSSGRPSFNPTPRNPVALRLAALDKGRDVIYLARPCQYIDLKTDTNCHNRYWTSHRYSKEVIATYGALLDQIKKSKEAGGFHLVGFSGGGAIAAILAATRRDILSLKTVAGNLDIVQHSNLHKVKQLHGSINPAGYATGLRHMPQRHLVGGKDDNIPPGIAKSFVAKQGNENCAFIREVSNASHNAGWEEIWRDEWKRSAGCRNKF